MKRFWFNGAGQLREGWWAAVFVLVVAVLFAGFQATTPILHRLGIKAGSWVEGVMTLIALGATWICVRLRREGMASVGFKLDRRWAGELGWGVLLGAALMGVAAGLVWVAGGVTFQLDPARSLRVMASGFLMFAMVGLFEESLFRGFLFQRLLAGIGVWPAQLILAAAFALIHWGNPGMAGAVKLWATADIALAAVLMGLAYLRTRSLALPVGIHLGWNWTQGNVLGFGVSGTTAHGWVLPVFHGKPDWLSGGAFGLEASLMGVIAVAIAIGLMARWKGTAV